MHVPEGFAVVTPYIVVANADRYVRFLEQAFGAREIGRSTAPDGRIANCQLGFGPTTIMVSEAPPETPAGAVQLYLYVADADDAVAQAVAAGGEQIGEVADQPYGDRQAGIRDFAGNIWWVSQRLTAEPYF